MGSYRVLLTQSAERELEDVPRSDRRRLAVRLRELSAQPRPSGAVKLAGRDLYRVRQGNYRILYEVEDRDRTVTIIRIGHRGAVYR